jgi:hypothetical protein
MHLGSVRSVGSKSWEIVDFSGSDGSVGQSDQVLQIYANKLSNETVCLYNPGYRALNYASSGRPLMGPLGEKNRMWVNGKKCIIFWSQSLNGLDMFCVGPINRFSRKEFDRLLCNCSVKGCRENTMRKTPRLVCDITLPATGADKTDNLPIGITETRHMPQLIMVHLFRCCYPPLGKKQRSGAERSPCPYQSCADVAYKYIIRVESSEGR